MSGTTAGGVPGAGWFPDPAGGPHLRWWDGSTWTENFIDPVTGTPIPSATPEHQSPVHVLDDDAPISRRALRESGLEPARQQPEPEPAAPAADVAPFAPLMPGPDGPAPWVSAPPPRVEDAYPIQAEPAYVPMARSEPRRALVQQVYVGTAQTASGWIFALFPLVQLAVILAVYLQFPTDVTDIVHVLLLVFPVPISLLLAVLDRTKLRENGHSNAPTPLLALIPPIYLAVRLARVGVRGLGPLLAWLVTVAGGILLLIVMFPSVFGALQAFDTSATDTATTPPPTATSHVLSAAERANDLTPTGMAATLKQDFIGQGINLVSVTCPPLASTEDGASVTCTGTLGVGSLDITVSVANELPTAAFDVVSAVPGT